MCFPLEHLIFIPLARIICQRWRSHFIRGKINGSCVIACLHAHSVALLLAPSDAQLLAPSVAFLLAYLLSF